MGEPAKGPLGLRRGRGARERLVAAAVSEFRDHGVGATGIDRVCAAAHVSKRTAYQHFGSKTELVLAALRAQDLDALPGNFFRPDLSPREQLLAVFAKADDGAPWRLCPFVGAAVESPDPDGPIRSAARDYKHAVTERLTSIAREAGAADPRQLGEELALLLDGASVRTHVLDPDAAAIASRIAVMLVDAATS